MDYVIEHVPQAEYVQYTLLDRGPSIKYQVHPTPLNNSQIIKQEGIDNGTSTLVESDKHKGGPPPKLTAIFGIISDLITGKPIKNAEVKCKGKNYHDTNTNASGYYELINLKDGNWKLKFSEIFFSCSNITKMTTTSINTTKTVAKGEKKFTPSRT